MIAGMGKAQDPGPGSRVDNPQDVEVTGDPPMFLTTFVSRDRELDELADELAAKYGTEAHVIPPPT